MTVQCLSCAKWSMQKVAEAMARQGYGACEKHEPWICYSGIKPRDCPDHAPAATDVTAERAAFFDKIKRVET